MITSGLIIAIIASFHILPSHLATGAFWFNVYIEREAVRKNRPELFEFLKKFTLLILIFSFVIGSITGVGIWYSATVASPRGISGLIHNYVWGWATEWVFFILEIATIYVYYYTLGRIDKESHLKIGLTYALAAWISMIIITGILAFMLTTGKWSETGGFFDGFFNETYWPQLFVRTSMMFGIAGLYAVIVASRMKNDEVGKEIIKKASIWGIAGMVFGAIFSLWYLQKLPENAKEMAFYGGLPYLKTLLYVAGTSYVVVLLYFVFFGLIRPRYAGVVSGIIMLIVLFVGIGAGEGFREGVRRPFVISQYMYGNQLIGRDIPAKGIKNEVERYQEEGFIKNIYWAGGLNLEEPKDRIKAGRILTLYVCGNCHSLEVNGIIRPLPVLLSRLDPESPDDIADFMDALGDYPYMPPFPGNDEDKALIGEFLFTLPKGGM
ncbi:Cytochrome c family protein [Dissulfuribacter thermophilus]|uniref:Cytochrome c family protein n=1 Tax=Dissulfuribacter thermophilus TaxID=1156395 RepID=A0A1B9F7M8_9BACT|nr:Cytochrome c family protein [Dissulfuribacter thermophilus]